MIILEFDLILYSLEDLDSYSERPLISQIQRTDYELTLYVADAACPPLDPPDWTSKLWTGQVPLLSLLQTSHIWLCKRLKYTLMDAVLVFIQR